eukprot:ANDGO_05025.mRNA.1 Kinesin-like protein KIN-4A
MEKMSASNARVSVAIRMRPGAGEILRKDTNNPSVINLFDPRVTGSERVEREFGFDKIFDDDATQEAVFDHVCKPLVEHVFEGFNACCFAYGQTGSGKTYSIFGLAGEKRGVVPRAMECIFETIEKRRPYAHIATFVSFLEIYMDDIGDLGKIYVDQKQASRSAPATSRIEYNPPSQRLENPQKPASASMRPSSASVRPASAVSRPGSAYTGYAGSVMSTGLVRKPDMTQRKYFDEKLDIRENPDGSVFVKDLATIPVSSVSEVMEIINLGVAQRATFETMMNAYSSRSHTIFTITIVQTNKTTEETMTGMLNLVDLAGSERLKRSESEGQRFKEAVVINKSLSALGNVILGLDSNANYIHYRDSKLTRILQDSLGGNSFTTLLATTYPTIDNYEECMATLQFAKRCKNVQNHPRVNYVELSAAQQEGRIRKLQEEIARLREEKEQQQDQFQRKMNELMSKMSMFGVQFDADGTILGTRSARGIGDGFGGSGGLGGASGGGTGSDEASSSFRKKAEHAEKEREQLNKKLEERRIAFAKAQEQARSEVGKHAAEVSDLKSRIAQLQDQLTSLQSSKDTELENARRSLATELERIQGGNDRIFAEQLKLLQNLPEAFKAAMKSSISPEATNRLSKGAISEEHHRQLLRAIDASNSQALTQIRDMYQSFIQSARNEICNIKYKAEQEKKDFEQRILETGRQRDLLYQLTLNLVRIAESGKTFPKHVGGTGIVLPEYNPLMKFDTSVLDHCVKRSAVIVKEAEDPLRPVVPRSHSRTASMQSLTSPMTVSSSLANTPRPTSARPSYY